MFSKRTLVSKGLSKEGLVGQVYKNRARERGKRKGKKKGKMKKRIEWVYLCLVRMCMYCLSSNTKKK